jgi:hypothetical protein
MDWTSENCCDTTLRFKNLVPSYAINNMFGKSMTGALEIVWPCRPVIEEWVETKWTHAKIVLLAIAYEGGSRNRFALASFHIGWRRSGRDMQVGWERELCLESMIKVGVGVIVWEDRRSADVDHVNKHDEVCRWCLRRWTRQEEIFYVDMCLGPETCEF